MGASVSDLSFCSGCDTRLMTVSGVHHVQLAMPPGGEREATAFYEELLGIPRVTKPPHLEARGGCWFETETVRIHLGVEDGFEPAEKAHPALLVDDLDSLRQWLSDAGVTVGDDQPLSGFDRFYASDRMAPAGLS
jgi:catechol 2,3-dioxygenase-like lactoylglutathione lyase family enzyme